MRTKGAEIWSLFAIINMDLGPLFKKTGLTMACLISYFGYCLYMVDGFIVVFTEISEVYCSGIGTAGNKVKTCLPNSLGG